MGLNILIIEADNLLQEHLSWHAKGKDWRMFKSGQQKDIKRIIKRRNIDVVLLSLEGLKKEGLSFLKMIKKMRPAIQVITINSGEQISLSIEVMKLGAFDDLLMPLDIDLLISRIHEAYKEKKASEVVKPSLFQRYQDLMVAASFAEAGEADMAKEILEKEYIQKKHTKDKKRNKPNERRKK